MGKRRSDLYQRQVAQRMLLEDVVDGIFSGENYLIGKRLLDAAALRQDALASNVANVETPGYKRVDIDKAFETQLATAVKQRDIEDLQTLRPKLTQDVNASAVRADGNNVAMDRELMEINRNTVEYQFLTQYLSNNLQAIKNAITSSNNN